MRDEGQSVKQSGHGSLSDLSFFGSGWESGRKTTSIEAHICILSVEFREEERVDVTICGVWRSPHSVRWGVGDLVLWRGSSSSISKLESDDVGESGSVGVGLELIGGVYGDGGTNCERQ